MSQGHYYENRKRGPMPKISWLDGIIHLLTLYKTGDSIENLSAFCGYSSTTFRDAIDRARKALLPALKEKW